MVLRRRAQYVKRTALSTIEIALKNNKVSRQGRACPDLVVQTRTHDLRQPLRSTRSSRAHPGSDRRHRKKKQLRLNSRFPLDFYLTAIESYSIFYCPAAFRSPYAPSSREHTPPSFRSTKNKSILPLLFLLVLRLYNCSAKCSYK